MEAALARAARASFETETFSGSDSLRRRATTETGRLKSSGRSAIFCDKLKCSFSGTINHISKQLTSGIKKSFVKENYDSYQKGMIHWVRRLLNQRSGRQLGGFHVDEHVTFRWTSKSIVMLPEHHLGHSEYGRTTVMDINMKSIEKLRRKKVFDSVDDFSFI